MSSMRNAVQRRNHKERSQPQGREKWGILEKHKDYTLRARDYNLKKRKLSILNQKARDRNPDEFAFGMLSAEKSKQGKHGQNSLKNRLDHDTVKLLKTQDQGYLRTVGQKGKREVEELERAVRMGEMIDGARFDEDEEIGQLVGRKVSKSLGKKVIFVHDEDENEKEEGDSEVQRRSTTTPRQSTQTEDQVNGADLSSEDGDIDVTTSIKQSSKTQTPLQSPSSKKLTKSTQSTKFDLRQARKRRKRLGELRAAKLEALKVRQKQIMAAAEELELQRARMSKSVGGVNKNGVGFRIRERKR